MLNFSSVMIGTSQLKVLAEFYEAVFDRPADMSDDEYHGWAVGNGFVMVGSHSEIHGEAKEPQRVILNFETKEVEEEFARLAKIKNITVIKEPYEMGGSWIATLADPDGNYFQLMTPWE